MAAVPWVHQGASEISLLSPSPYGLPERPGSTRSNPVLPMSLLDPPFSPLDLSSPFNGHLGSASAELELKLPRLSPPFWLFPEHAKPLHISPAASPLSLPISRWPEVPPPRPPLLGPLQPVQPWT